jgi:glycosyltransferase involved in cell wall biosynthesis
MRILIVDHGAVESARRAVYRVLAARKEFEIHLLVPNRWKEQETIIFPEAEKRTHLKLHTSQFLFGYRFHRAIYTDLFRAVKEIQPHFLYIDTEPENYSAVEAIIVRRLLCPRTKLGLVSSRNLDHRSIGFPYKLSFTHRLCDSITLKSRVDIIFLRTNAGTRLIQPYAARTVYLPFPVDCSHFKKLNLGESICAKKHIVIGFVGRLVKAKGVALLVEALPHLSEKVQLLIVGKGPLLRELQELTEKLQVQHRTTFLPSVPYAEVPKIFNKIDVLALPSLDTKYWVEQCPRVLIEAMACEVPIVASDSGGIPEVIGDAGLLFRVANREDLVEKLRQVVSDPSLRARLAGKGRTRALELYDVPILADRMADAILKTLRS